jgi:hypothetical protein
LAQAQIQGLHGKRTEDPEVQYSLWMYRKDILKTSIMEQEVFGRMNKNFADIHRKNFLQQYFAGVEGGDCR